MAFEQSSGGDVFKTKVAAGKFSPGFGILISLDSELPRKWDEKTMAVAGGKGYVMVGTVTCLLGDKGALDALVVGAKVRVTVRPSNLTKNIFDDLEKTREASKFLLEGVSGTDLGALEARWVHGAGSNRSVEHLEIVGPPQVSFDNPNSKDGPRTLRVQLDGTPTVFDERRDDDVLVRREFSYSEVVDRLRLAVDNGLKFRVSQRVLEPSSAVLVNGQGDLTVALTEFRRLGYTGCVVRSFVPGTKVVEDVDVQTLWWPLDAPANGTFAGAVYDMPTLQETKRFVALRDGEAIARMEVVPGYAIDLIGNSDVTKSTKHKFVADIVKGLSDKQKAMFGGQNYGPGIAIRLVNDGGEVSGLTRLAIRTDGGQVRSLVQVVTPNFLDADKVVLKSQGVLAAR